MGVAPANGGCKCARRGLGAPCVSREFHLRNMSKFMERVYCWFPSFCSRNILFFAVQYFHVGVQVMLKKLELNHRRAPNLDFLDTLSLLQQTSRGKKLQKLQNNIPHTEKKNVTSINATIFFSTLMEQIYIKSSTFLIFHVSLKAEVFINCIYSRVLSSSSEEPERSLK